MFIFFSDSGRRMHTVMNVYIGNLALADVIIAVFCIPFQFQAALKNYWDLPAFMCKLCPFLQVGAKMTRLCPQTFYKNDQTPRGFLESEFLFCFEIKDYKLKLLRNFIFNAPFSNESTHQQIRSIILRTFQEIHQSKKTIHWYPR